MGDIVHPAFNCKSFAYQARRHRIADDEPRFDGQRELQAVRILLSDVAAKCRSLREQRSPRRRPGLIDVALRGEGTGERRNLRELGDASEGVSDLLVVEKQLSRRRVFGIQNHPVAIWRGFSSRARGHRSGW